MAKAPPCRVGSAPPPAACPDTSASERELLLALIRAMARQAASAAWDEAVTTNRQELPR